MLCGSPTSRPERAKKSGITRQALRTSRTSPICTGPRPTSCFRPSRITGVIIIRSLSREAPPIRPHRLAYDERREEQDPDHAGVLEKDRVRGGRPLRGHDERGEARAVADDREDEGGRGSPSRPEKGEQCDRGEQRSVERDFQRGIGDRLDADAAGRPQQCREGDQKNAAATVGHDPGL